MDEGIIRGFKEDFKEKDLWEEHEDKDTGKVMWERWNNR